MRIVRFLFREELDRWTWNVLIWSIETTLVNRACTGHEIVILVSQHYTIKNVKYLQSDDC